ncbi:MAG: alpha/beta hydrolase [Sulfitobacter sp.]
MLLDKVRLIRSRWVAKVFTALVATALAFGLSACQQVVVLALNQITTTHFEVRDDRLLMSGEINSKTLDQFEQVIALNPNIKTLVELNVPGSLDDDTMIALAYRVRELGLNTHLTATSEIYSGGVDLFLAGVQRTMEPGAKIGVHSWSDGTKEAKDFPRDAPEHEQNRRYIERMLGDDKFYWFTIYAASADDIHLMTETEIADYGLLSE